MACPRSSRAALPRCRRSPARTTSSWSPTAPARTWPRSPPTYFATEAFDREFARRAHASRLNEVEYPFQLLYVASPEPSGGRRRECLTKKGSAGRSLTNETKVLSSDGVSLAHDHTTSEATSRRYRRFD